MTREEQLVTAAKNGKTAAVQRLLAAGADVNARNEWGNTALTEAAVRGDRETVEALLAAGADVNVIVQALLARGVDIHDKKQGGVAL